MPNSFADVVNENKLMVAGLKANPEAVAKRGLDEAFVNNMDGAVKQIEKLNEEQEALKAALKTKTAALDAAVKSIKKTYSDAKTTVKMVIPQSQWVEFGITDKR